MVIEFMLHQLEEVHQATKLVWHNNKEENLGAKFKDAREFCDFMVVFSMLSLDCGNVSSAWV